MLAISATCANAYDFEANGMFFNVISLNDLTVELTRSDTYTDEFGVTKLVAPYKGDFVVPQTVEYSGRTFKVVGINRETFLNYYDNDKIKLTIPESITQADLMYASFEALTIKDSDQPIDIFGPYTKVNNMYLGRNVVESQDIGFMDSEIQDIIFGDEVSHITYSCFSGADLPTLINLNKIDSIFNRAFYMSHNITEITGENLSYIGDESFFYCISLKSANLPKGLAKLGNRTFSMCSSLESATIPASVISIGEDVFAECTALKTITACSATPVAISESTFDPQNYLNATLVVPAGAKEKYMNADNWKNFLNIVEDASIVDNVRSVSIRSNEDYGNIVAGGKTFGNGGYLSATVGESLTIEFVPKSEEYKVSSVMVDGREMVSAIEDNKLTLTISDNTSIDVEWDYNYVEPEPVYLSIKQAEGGCMKMEVDGWSTYEFVVEPSEGWKLHSVTLNGADITSTVGAAGELRISDITENSELAITFESTSSAISAAAASNARVYATGGNIVVAGAESGEPVSIYDEGGRLVSTATATGATMSIPVAAGHVYIVKLNGKTVKLAI